MATPTLHQLRLLADHLNLSLLERQRAVSLNREPHKQDSNISRSLSSLQEGIETLESQPPADSASDLSKLRTQFEQFYTQFHGSAPPAREPSDIPSDPQTDADDAHSRPSQARRNKSVRFRDDPDAEEDPAEAANRAALFSGDNDRYRDEPDAAPDQSQLDNQQIHTYHQQVLRDQDEQLDTLGQSIGRQRVLGIQMGDELDEQNELLRDVEGGVDRHLTTLERAKKRLNTVARKSKGNWSWVTIGILIVILILLIVVLN